MILGRNSVRCHLTRRCLKVRSWCRLGVSRFPRFQGFTGKYGLDSFSGPTCSKGSFLLGVLLHLACIIVRRGGHIRSLRWLMRRAPQLIIMLGFLWCCERKLLCSEWATNACPAALVFERVLHVACARVSTICLDEGLPVLMTKITLFNAFKLLSERPWRLYLCRFQSVLHLYLPVDISDLIGSSAYLLLVVGV